MPSVASQARLSMKDIDREGVDHDSPLEDQAVLVYRAVSHYADVNHWHSTHHRDIPGRVGPLVMKRLISDLFPKASKPQLEKINGLVNQVLRKTDAAVCKERPHKQGDMPIWFVADRMPANIVIVALSHAHKDHDSPAATAPRSDKEAKIAYIEKKLTPEESGETMPPGEVTVKQGEPRSPMSREPNEATLTAFELSRRERMREHAQFRARVYELVKEHKSITASELVHYLAQEGLTTGDSSATRSALNELIDAGDVVYRLEEFDERVVRGGGSVPKGGRTKVFGLAPGPVPIRTALPPGIEPARPARDWSAARKAEMDAMCDKILDAMSTHGTSGNRPPRTLIGLVEKTGLTRKEVMVGLERLESLEIAEKRSGRWYLSNNKPKERSGTPVQEAPAVDTVHPVVQPPAQPAPPLMGHTDLVAQAHAIIDQLTASTVDTERMAELEAENERLNGEVARLGRVVTNLRAALADMSD